MDNMDSIKTVPPVYPVKRHPSIPSQNTSNSGGSSRWLFSVKQQSAWRMAMQSALQRVSKKIKNTEKPFSGVQPHELAPAINKVDLEQPLACMEAALDEIDDLYLKDAVYFHHPRYMAHLNCPVAYPALAAELISSSINTAVDTWDQSAGATLIEQKLIDWASNLIGYQQEADGVFTSGGTQSNFMAMLLARDAYCREQLNNHNCKEQGLPVEASRFRIYTSAASHFSVQKAAALLGLGYNAVVSISCDKNWRMDAWELATEIKTAKKQGLLPIAIVATAGTTDFGSIDPVANLSNIAKEHELWLHVDAAYGGGLLLSPSRRHLLTHIEQANSVTIDFHKSFLQPVACSAFICQNAANLSSVTHYAEYLNPLSADRQGTPNLVNKSLQTTRRFDALKLWLTLRTMGPQAIGQAFDDVCLLTQKGHELIAEDPDFCIIHQPELSTLVFRWQPASTKGMPDKQLNDLNDAIRQALFDSGEAMVAGTRIDGKRFLKITLLNPLTEISDIHAVLCLISNHGQRLIAEYQGKPNASAAA